MKKFIITLALSFLFFFLFIPNSYALEIDKNDSESGYPTVHLDDTRFQMTINQNDTLENKGIESSYSNYGIDGIDFPVYSPSPDFIGPVNSRNSVYNFSFNWKYKDNTFGIFKKDIKYEIIFRFTDKENILVPLNISDTDSNYWLDEFFLGAYDMDENSDTYEEFLYNNDIFEEGTFGFISEPIDKANPQNGTYHYFIVGFIPKQNISSVSIQLQHAPQWNDGQLVNGDKDFYELFRIDKTSSEPYDYFVPLSVDIYSVNEFTLKDVAITPDDDFSGILDGMVSLTDGTNSCEGITDIGCWFENLWIVLGNLWKNLGRIFYNMLNLLWEIIDLSIQSILQPLKQLVTFFLSFWEYLWDGLKDCFTWLYDNVLEPLGQFIIDGIVASFEFLDDYIVTPIITAISDILIPDGDYLSTQFQGLFKFIDEKLGFLTFPFEFIVNFLNRFLNIPNDPVKNITVPSISLGSFGTLIHGFTFNIAEYWEKAPFKQIYDVYLLFIHAFIVFGLYKLCNRKFEEMTGGSNK